MKVSFIIPAKNEEKYILGCIGSIITTATNLFSFEIIVVDNGSTDQTKNAVTDRGCKIIDAQECTTIGQVRNKGAEFAKGEYLIFVDADSEVNFELLSIVEHYITHKYIGGGALGYVEDNKVAKIIMYLWNKYCRKTNTLTGYFLFVKRQTFNILGGFNPTLALCEDVDFSKRLNNYDRCERPQLIEGPKVKTSARKLRLYSIKEHLTFIYNLIFNFKTTILSTDKCFIHYNIRR